MSRIIQVSDNIYYIGVNDRDTSLFENLWPLPKGVSYNSYIIKDEKNVLIDTVKISKVSLFIDKIRSVLSGRSLDYLVINHMEPDHSGGILEIIEEYPDIKIVGNKKTFEFLNGFYNIGKNLYEVRDGDRINIGRMDLEFFLTPMVHWPETMMTYESSSKILFSGDAFGGFGSLDGGIFDDEVNIDYFENEIRRYYSNIVGKFGPMVQKAILKLKEIDIRMIASTHGPVWRNDPGRIIASYDRWSRNETEPGVVIAYGSMYGNTEKMADYTARKISENGIKNIRVLNTSNTHPSYIINEIWKYNSIIIGSCTYNNGIFPPVETLLIALAHKGLKGRSFGLFGTYGWNGGAVKKILKYIEQNSWDLASPPVVARLSPGGGTYSELDKLSKDISEKIKNY